jgi:hypothetical protein
MKKLMVLSATTLLSVSAFAGEKDTHSDMKHTTATFESLDKNADQQVSKSEASADKVISDSFATADTNGDGYLSKTEFMVKPKS